ncbi:MAG TPA: carbohydrate kinase, partial [Planctomycetaceae bacterium]|nr:carbohydrate kinase [Planctomycetaceae bacterium]
MKQEATAAHVVVGLGEVLWDCIGETRHPGGAPANVAFHAAQLGCRGVVCSRVGADALGDEFLTFLQSQGLETAFVQRDPEHPTGRATVDASVPGRPQFIIHENVAWDCLAFDEPTRELMAQADAVCFGTLAQRSETSRETIHRCLASLRLGCLKVYDVNLRQSYYTRERIERSLAAADLVKLNVDEAGVLAPLLELRPDAASRRTEFHSVRDPERRIGEPELASFARSVCERFAVETVCITRAERGCLVCSGSEVVDLPGRAVEVVDAVGAGDAFTAALILARLERWPLRAGAAFA